MAKVNPNELAAQVHHDAQQYCKAMDRAAYGSMVVGDDLGDALGVGAQAGGQLLSGNAGAAGGTLGGAAGGALGSAIGGDSGQAVGQAAGKLLGTLGGQAAGQAAGIGGSGAKQGVIIISMRGENPTDPKSQGVFAARAGQAGVAYYVPKGADPRKGGRKTAQGTWSSQAVGQAPAGYYFTPAQWSADMQNALWTSGRPHGSAADAKSNLSTLVHQLGQKYGIAQ